MRLKLRGELTLAFVLLAVAPLVTVGAFSIWESARTLHNEVESSQRVVAELAAVETELFLKSFADRLALLADSTDTATDTPDEVELTLQLLIAHSKTFSGAAYLAPDGTELVRVSQTQPTALLELRDRSDAPEVRYALDVGEVGIGEVLWDLDTGVPTIRIAATAFNYETGTPGGVFTAILQLQPLWDRVATISAQHGGTTYIVDAYNRVVAHPNPSVVLRGTEFSAATPGGTRPGLDGESVVAASSSITVGGQTFTLIAETPTDTAFASLRSATWVIVGGIAVAVVTAVVLALLTVRRLIRPIEHLADRAHRVSRGDLSAAPVKLAGPAELRALTTTFDKTVAAIRERQRQIDEQSAQLRESNRQLEESVAAAEESTEAERRASMELAQREQRLNAILTTAADAIIGISDRGEIESFNAAAEDMFGYTSSEVIGQSIEELMPAATAEGHQQSVDNYVETGQATTVVGQVREDTARRRDGSEFPIQLSVSEVRDISGRSFTGIIRDMTSIRDAEHELETQAKEARKLAEQASEAARVKTQFLATMSHEIRTPMNGVIGMTDLMLGTPLSDEQREYAAAIRSSGDTLLALINDTLDFSKIEAGKVDFEANPFSLRDTVYEIAELLGHRDDASGLELLVNYPASTPHRVIGDAGRVRQVLLNLGSNAVKFTEHGQVTITVSDVRTRADGAHELAISVSDSGIGIPAARLGAIFEEFTQVDASTTRNYGGTGLGLAIVRQLVDQMGGTIDVRSVEGAGSTFTVTLPLEIQDETDERRPPPGLADARVLVASDRAATRSSLVDQLEAWQINAVAAASTEEVVQRIRAAADAPFDVLICDSSDISTSRLTIDRVRSRCPESSNIRIVLVVTVEDRAAVSSIPNVAAVTTRPTSPSRLMNAIATAMGQRSPLDRVAAPENTFSRPGNTRVLVAEDNTVNQIVARKMLEKLGCTVDVVADGVAAVAAVEQTSYDIVFMDCQMPNLDGYEATRSIRSGEGDAHVPIVAMTANAMEGDRERCLEAGMDDYIAKPVSVDLLPAMLNRWLNTDLEDVA